MSTTTMALPVSLRPAAGEVCLRDAGGKLLRVVGLDEADAHVAKGAWVWFGGGRRRHVRVKGRSESSALIGTRTWTGSSQAVRVLDYAHKPDVCARWRERA